MLLPKRGSLILHLKTNNLYRFIGASKHSETLVELAVYERDGKIWIRPLAMFLDGRFAFKELEDADV
jgi:hypothetical protein